MNFRDPIHQRPDDDELRIVARLQALAVAAGLAETAPGTWYGTGALKVAGKGFVRLKDPETLVVFCASHDEKAALLACEPDLYFETDHYRGSAAFLVRLPKIDDPTLSHRLVQSWLVKAPPRLRKAFVVLRQRPDEAPPAGPNPRARGSRSRPA